MQVTSELFSTVRAVQGKVAAKAEVLVNGANNKVVVVGPENRRQSSGSPEL